MLSLVFKVFLPENVGENYMRRFHAFLTGVMQVNITSFFSPCSYSSVSVLFQL